MLSASLLSGWDWSLGGVASAALPIVLSGGGSDVVEVQLPARTFLYTLDQIATMLAVPLPTLRKMVHYDGRTIGKHDPNMLLARQIGPLGQGDWRVAERELLRWFSRRGYRVVSTTIR